MTREEAIRCLSVHSSTNGSGLCTDEQHYEAKQMAIKALEQEPIEVEATKLQMAYNQGFEDCRKAVIDELKKWDWQELYLPIHFKENIIDVIPSVNPQEPSGDTIDRDELLKAIDTWDKFGVDDTNSLFRLDNLSLPHYVPYIHYDDVIKCIKSMPPVNPQVPKYCDRNICIKNEYNGIGCDECEVTKSQEPKMGHWIDDEFGSKCSCCGIHTHLDKFDRPMKFKYCSMCGAEMAESEDKE